jgi:hypothetical protein
MKAISVRSIILTIIVATSLIFTATVSPVKSKSLPSQTDFDPLTDEIEVTVEIQKIRSLEKFDHQIPVIEKIDWFSAPDFYVKVFINEVEFTSDVWHNTKYVYDPQWSASLVVPDDEEFVDIKIQLWDWNFGRDRLCDISSIYDDGYRDSFDVELTYSIKTGHWFGDDFTNLLSWMDDPSGYGRLNGCDDRSIYQRDRDCELWFDIYQTDPDGDGIPYWTEVNVYGTDPEVDNTGDDSDGDGCPIEWEHKWGHYMWHDWHDDGYYHFWEYDDSVWDDHENLDPDEDGLDNVEEYLTSQWDSDPFRKDLFVELDQMEESPDGQQNVLPEGSKELLRTAYDRQNVVYHLDDGCMGGSDMIPFEELVNRHRLQEFYWDYFLHGNESNPRHGIFYYGVVVYNADYHGYVFLPDSWQISAKVIEENKTIPKIQAKRDIAFASAYMHECGHTLGIYNGNTPGCDDQNGKYPWQRNWWKWRPYKSCMNYGYMYKIVDYSDGSRGRNDFDDWQHLDFSFFKNSHFEWPK